MAAGLRRTNCGGETADGPGTRLAEFLVEESARSANMEMSQTIQVGRVSAEDVKACGTIWTRGSGRVGRSRRRAAEWGRSVAPSVQGFLAALRPA
jgi:hypothetical protein